jgi:hypothetical protein
LSLHIITVEEIHGRLYVEVHMKNMERYAFSPKRDQDVVFLVITLQSETVWDHRCGGDGVQREEPRTSSGWCTWNPKS